MMIECGEKYVQVDGMKRIHVLHVGFSDQGI